jgi:hypothetical protein
VAADIYPRAEEVDTMNLVRPLKKRCRILPAGGLEVSPSFKKVPQDWGTRGLIEIISAVSDIKAKANFLGWTIEDLSSESNIYIKLRKSLRRMQ